VTARQRASIWLGGRWWALVLTAGLLVLLGCDGGSSSNDGSSPNGGSAPSSGSAPSGGSASAFITGPNAQPITVNTAFPEALINTLLTSVTLCVPGTTTCQTIPNILVDTGSSGVRILASQLSLTLPPVTSESAPLGECFEFVDAAVWGAVVTADVGLAEAKALSVPIQLIGSPSFAAPPVACTRSGLPLQDTPQGLHANGILGVGLFVEDCAACDPQHNPRAAVAPPAIYFSCPSVSGTFLCMPTAVPLPDQVQNPVWLLPQDNNGVLIALPPIAPGGAASVVGTLVFGIGTAANNGLGSAQVYTTDALGHFTTTFAATAYPTSYVDTGSNLLFILDATHLGLPLCGANTDAAGAYCPATPVSFTATTTGANGVTGTVTFSIANATTLLNSPNVAFNDVATPFTSGPEAFAWGLPFFFGRTVFVAIQGQSTPDGPGPYWAY